MSRALVPVLLPLAGLVFACAEPDPDSFVSDIDDASRSAKRGGKKQDPPPPPPEPEPEPDYEWYVLVEPVDFDPLYRFGQTDDLVLLQTDPSVTSWGTDYWGYWDEPFAFDGEIVDYTIGLSHTTYTLTDNGDGTVEVERTLEVSAYLGGGITTTHTEVGLFVAE